MQGGAGSPGSQLQAPRGQRAVGCVPQATDEPLANSHVAFPRGLVFFLFQARCRFCTGSVSHRDLVFSSRGCVLSTRPHSWSFQARMSARQQNQLTGRGWITWVKACHAWLSTFLPGTSRSKADKHRPAWSKDPPNVGRPSSPAAGMAKPGLAALGAPSHKDGPIGGEVARLYDQDFP